MSALIVPKESIRESLEKATAEYQKQLQNDDEALSYLADRQIGSEAQAYFRLGVVRDPMPGHEFRVGRLTFPYITPTGVVTIRFRAIGEAGEKAKFLPIPGDGARPYNVLALRNTSKVWIIEGETDTIAFWQAGIPAVGFPGANSWSRQDDGSSIGKVFARMFYGRQVTVMCDSDGAGDLNEKIEASKNFAETIKRYLGGCEIMSYPKGYDGSKYFVDFGLDKLRELVGYDPRSRD